MPTTSYNQGMPFDGERLAVTVDGSAAEDAPAAGNPVLVAGVVRTAVAPTTLVSGDVSRCTMTNGGALVQKLYAVPEADWAYASAAAGIAVTTDVVVKAAAAAGVRNYVTAMQISNNSAVATEFVIKDGASTVLWRGLLSTNAPLTLIEFPSPLRGTAATAINVACLTVGAAVYVNLQGYIAP